MYVDPFWFGVVIGIFATLATLVIVAGIISRRNK